MTIELLFGDCIDLMATLADNSVDTLVTDPPGGIDFMGKQWDDLSNHEPRTERGVAVSKSLLPLVELGVIQNWEAGFLIFTVDWAYSALRVLKPGGSGLVWSIPRTNDLTQFGLRLAGFEVKDTIAHVFGQGFPKNFDIGKGIDQKLGAEGEVVGEKKLWGHNAGTGAGSFSKNQYEGQTGIVRYEPVVAPATPEAELWDGWGTALKPAREDWILVQKPREGTYAENALKWGVAGLNIDGARVPLEEDESVTINTFDDGAKPFGGGAGHEFTSREEKEGRWPANITHDGSDEVVDLFPTTSSGKMMPTHSNAKRNTYGQNAKGGYVTMETYGDDGSAARFFYTAKVSRAERNAGLEGDEKRADRGDYRPNDNGDQGLQSRLHGATKKGINHHPTCKSISLMEYLVRLTKTPTGGVVLDPFVGSGTTAIACILNNRDLIGMENDKDYFEIAEKRITFWQEQVDLGHTSVDEVLKVSRKFQRETENKPDLGIEQGSLF